MIENHCHESGGAGAWFNIIPIAERDAHWEKKRQVDPLIKSYDTRWAEHPYEVEVKFKSVDPEE
ncbi:hypothetical protein BY996DRAFT_6511328 [Phakopsora pachyrhizi]|nr:hypothetical protein BY996DRAFT_6511328 [Phakopsora pachyrhizi]